MSYRPVEVLGRVERRRRFSLEQKLAVVAEACAPGAVVSEVARRHALLPAQVFKWRRLVELGVIGIPGASELPSFLAVEVAAGGEDMPAAVATPTRWGSPVPNAGRDRGRGLIEIDLGDGRCVRVDGAVDADALRRVLDVLAR